MATPELKKKNKYNFQWLDIGESMEVYGVESRIRTQACMWGTRYGIWLRAEKVRDGVMKVTRLRDPIRQRQPGPYKRIEQRLDAMAELLKLIFNKTNDYELTT